MATTNCSSIRTWCVLLLAGLLAACGGSSSSGGGGATGSDVSLQEPLFRGVLSIATAGGTAVRLDWRAADDNRTAPASITYRVYGSATSGGQNFAAPLMTTAPGATSAIVGTAVAPFLALNTPAYFVVRAVDGDGNEDGNTTELCVVPTPAASIAFVSDTAGGAGTLGDASDPFPTIQAAVTAIEGNGAGSILIDADAAGTIYNEEVDSTVGVDFLQIFGGFARFSALPAAPTGVTILATRDLVNRRTTLSGAGLLPLVDDDLFRVTTGSPTHIDGLVFDGCQTLTPLTGTISLTNGSARVLGNGTLLSTEAGAGSYIQLDADGVPMYVNETEGQFEGRFRAPYPGPGGTGPGSLVTVDAPALRALDASIQVSCCTLAGGTWMDFDTTAVTIEAQIRLIGLSTEGEWDDTVQIEGGLRRLRAQNNRIHRRGCFVETIDTATELVNASTNGLEILITDNDLNDNRVEETNGWFDLDLDAANPADGGPFTLLIARNELRNCSGDAVEIDGYHQLGDGASVDIRVYDNLGHGTSSSVIDFESTNFVAGFDPAPNAPVSILVYDNTFINGNGDPIETDVSVSAGQTTTCIVRDNFLSVSESETIEIDDREGDTDDTSDGGTFHIEILRNVHYSGGEELSAEVGVPHNGYTNILFRENTVLGTEEPCIELEARDPVGTSTSSYAYPNGIWCATIMNNDLTANDDHAIEFEDRRDESGVESSKGLLYIGHNICRQGSDPFRGALFLRYDADYLSAVVERNFCGIAGDDSSEAAIETETNSDALSNFIRIRNNVATACSGGGIEVEGDGAPPQLINNTIAYSGQQGQPGLESANSQGWNQVFCLNCVLSHNSSDVDREAGVSPTYSLIRDEPVPFGFGNLGGEPFYARELQDLPLFGVSNVDLINLYVLRPTSPAVNAGHPAARYNDVDGTRNDMGAYGGPGGGLIGILPAGTIRPFVLLGASPTPGLFTGEPLLSNTQTLWFGFSRPVNASTISAGISLTNGGVAIPGTWSTLAGGHVLQFVPTGTLDVGGAPFVRASFTDSLLDTNGGHLRIGDILRFPLEPAASAEVEPNDDASVGITLADLAVAQAIAFGPLPGTVRVTASVTGATDEDVYSFTATAGQRLQATTLDARLGNGLTETHLELYDANGDLIDIAARNLFNQDNVSNEGDAYLDHVFATGGTYYLVVRKPLAVGAETYELQGSLDD